MSGYRFIAVAEAPVYEIVPPNRWTVRYYLTRALVHGYNSYKYLSAGRWRLRRIAVPAESLVRLAANIVFFPVYVVIGLHACVKGMESISYHFSRFLAAFGIEIKKRRDF